jgi:hypothetical protein
MWMEYSIDVAIIFHPSGNNISKIFSYVHKSEAHMFTSSWLTFTCSHGNDIVYLPTILCSKSIESSIMKIF